MWSTAFYRNPNKYSDEIEYKDFYKVLDTIKNKSSIAPSDYYAVRWHDSYNWGTGIGEQFIERYDSWREKDPDIVIIHLKKFNRENALEYERKLINQASETPAVDPDVVHRIALYYENRGNYNKASDVYELSLKHKKNNPGILGYYSLSQYENSESDKAKEAAEKALSIEPKNVIALQVMAQIEADDYNWGEAKKWAKKAIDYGCENAEPYYVYAQSLYKLEEKEAARTYYNKAYNLNGYSPLAQKYSQCGGCPFEIVSMSIAFTSHDGKIITDYGQKLYSSKSQYITTKAKLNVLRDESCTIQCKLYCRGLLSTGDNSPSGCTYESELYFFKTGIVEREIGGWGNDTSGNWPAGNYRFEIWYNGEKVGEETFRLY
jgi:tetratricopeptide (TPR) repeat protein